MTKSYTIDTIDKFKNCNNKSKEETVQIINDIILKIRQNLLGIEQGNIISIKNFTQFVADNCKNLFINNFNDGRTHDSKEVYKNIMSILGIEMDDCNDLFSFRGAVI